VAVKISSAVPPTTVRDLQRFCYSLLLGRSVVRDVSFAGRVDDLDQRQAVRSLLHLADNGQQIDGPLLCATVLDRFRCTGNRKRGRQGHRNNDTCVRRRIRSGFILPEAGLRDVTEFQNRPLPATQSVSPMLPAAVDDVSANVDIPLDSAFINIVVVSKQKLR
jgi:hypothetical protein